MENKLVLEDKSLRSKSVSVKANPSFSFWGARMQSMKILEEWISKEIDCAIKRKSNYGWKPYERMRHLGRGRTENKPYFSFWGVYDKRDAMPDRVP